MSPHVPAFSSRMTLPLPIRPHSPRRGFSLIELLVSISIIAVLLGILIPVLPRIRDSARRAACGANLAGVGQAMEMYKGQNKDKFPVARYMPPPWLSGDTDPPLNEALEAFAPASAGGWRCPGDSIVYDFEYTDAQGARRTCGSSYTYISTLSGLTFDQSFYARFLKRTPTSSPVVHDYDGGAFETQTGDLVQVPFFHAKRNILFADGHVGDIPESLQ